MVIINDKGELEGIEGTVSELAENSAVLYATVLRHVREDNAGSRGARLLTEVLTEAWIRTVMELMTDEESSEAIIRACKTVGETGYLSAGTYKVTVDEGVVS